MVAYTPLYLQRYLIEFNKIRQEHEMTRKAQETIWGSLTKCTRTGIGVIETGMEIADFGVNTFWIDHAWDRPTSGQARPSRNHGRNEPLQCPEFPPPKGQTLAHGRWISEQGSVLRKWVSYPPCGEGEMLDLPPNVPMTAAHWRFRKLPNGVQIADVTQLKDMILDH